jgi:hypothetical protein
MNRRVLRLLVDYFRRTFGIWPLLFAVQVMQVSAFWALHVDRIPLLAVVIAGLTYFVAIESPAAVLRTLPISRQELVSFRRWAGVGAPALVVLACTLIAWQNNGDNDWPRPALSEAALCVALSWAALVALTLVPRRTGARFFWAGLSAVGFYGVPWDILSPAGLVTLAVLGVLAFTLKRGKVKRADPSSGSGARMGWSMIVADVARGTIVLSLVALGGVSLARWLYPIDAVMPVVWLFVSAVAVAACLQTRRWIQATRLLRLLPVNPHRLALILYAILITPGVTACLVAMGVNALMPQLGMAVPPYLLVVFLATPVTVIPWQPQRYVASAAVNEVQQWAPLMQLAAFPMWSGSLCAFGGPHLMPAWFLSIIALVAVGFAVASYFALLVGIRSPSGFERHTGPLGAPS